MVVVHGSGTLVVVVQTHGLSGGCGVKLTTLVEFVTGQNFNIEPIMTWVK